VAAAGTAGDFGWKRLDCLQAVWIGLQLPSGSKAAFMQEGFAFKLGLFSAHLKSRIFSYPVVNTLFMFIFNFFVIGFVLHNLSKLVAAFRQEGPAFRV
jgi:hypothetical protein